METSAYCDVTYSILAIVLEGGACTHSVCSYVTNVPVYSLWKSRGQWGNSNTQLTNRVTSLTHSETDFCIGRAGPLPKTYRDRPLSTNNLSPLLRWWQWVVVSIRMVYVSLEIPKIKADSENLLLLSLCVLKVIIVKIFILLSFMAPVAIISNCRCVFGPHFSFKFHRL